MVLHRQQAQFDRARWRMAILLPCWTLQLLLMLVITAIFAWRLATTVDQEDNEAASNIPIPALIWKITGTLFPLIGLGLTVFEIVKLANETLTPWTMLFTHVMKVVTSCASLSVDVVIYIEQLDRHYSIVGLVLNVLLILAVLVPAGYSILTYRRLASFDDYHHPANAKSFGYHDLEGQQAGADGRLSIGNLGAASLRRFSSSSVTGPIITATPPPVDSVRLTTMSRTPSYYNNERDTQFEQYMIEKSTGVDPDNQRGGNLTTPSRSASNATQGSFSTLGIAAAGGGRPSNLKSPRDSVSRASSWGSSHLLGAVPEADDEDAGYDALKADQDDVEETEDRKALLGARKRAGSEASEDEVNRTRRHRLEAMAALNSSETGREEMDVGEWMRKRNP